MRKEISDFDIWDYMYGALDLFSNKRKRCQIHLLKDLIFEIKKIYNEQYDLLAKERTKICEKVIEINNKITDTFEQLQKPRKLWKAKPNPLDNLDSILTVNGAEEIPFERYLTKVEREEIKR